MVAKSVHQMRLANSPFPEQYDPAQLELDGTAASTLLHARLFCTDVVVVNVLSTVRSCRSLFLRHSQRSVGRECVGSVQHIQGIQ